RRPLVGMAAVAAMLGWLQLAPAFGFPVTAPAGMLDRIFGAAREAGPVGWALLLLGEAVFVALYFVIVERRSRRPAVPIAFAIGLLAPTVRALPDAGRVVEGRLAALPAGPVFISVLELPQPAGAVLGPHKHVAGFIVDVSGTATMEIEGNVVDVGPGDAAFVA